MTRLLVFVFAAILSCDQTSPQPPPMESSLEPPLGMLGSVRRPATRYAMVRTGERCQVTIEWEAGLAERLPKDHACPKDLALGERILLSGATCIRAGETPARNVPVVCPDPLTNAERDQRQKASADAMAPDAGN